jgi:hypothetical protein
MYSLETGLKYCWLCGKDISLEHSKTDEHGLTVHESCHQKRMLLKAASAQVDSWKAAQPPRAA